jgi:hypothetical protein
MYSIDADGGIALAGETANLRAFDISNPADLRQTSTIALASTAWNIFIDGDWAFVANDVTGLSAVNISNPYSIGPRYSLGMSGGPTVYDVDVDGGLAYVAHSTGFSIVNVTDPGTWSGSARRPRRAL